MHDKLTRKGFSGDVAESAVVYLEEKGFINDRKLAGDLKRDAVERKHLGKRGIRSYLLRRGVPADIAALFSGRDEEDTDTAKRLVEKRLRHMKECDEQVIKRRLWGLLERRGFSPETVRTVIKSLNFKEEAE